MSLTATALVETRRVSRIRALCSGYGGLESAVEQTTGATVADHAEIDSAAAKVHAAHWPGIPNLGDITTVDWAELEPTEILCAGFPCQPISQAGRRKVTNDARWLWPHIAHAVRVLRPRLVVLENVPPLLRPWRDDDGWWNPAPIEEVAGDLAALGYVGSWRSVRASDVGAPHRRERVFIVAAPADTLRPGVGRDGRAVPRPPEGPRWAGGGLCAAVDARAAAPDSRGQGREGPGPAVETRRPRAALGRRPAPDTDCEPRRWSRDTERGDGPTPHVRRGPPQPRGRDRAAADTEDRASGQSHGGVGPDQPKRAGTRAGDRDRSGSTAEGVLELGRAAALLAWGPYGAAIQRWERLTRPAPAPTDDLGRLSPAFAEWMMGLPAGWVTGIDISRTAQLSVIGNGVVPQAAVAALTPLLAHLYVARGAA